MKFKVLHLLLWILVISGIFQYFLIPGVLWKIGFPYIQILVLLVLWAIKVKNRMLHMLCWVIAGISLFNIALDFYSTTNTSCTSCSSHMKVMTYNVFFKNADPLNSIQLILKEDPDVLLIQELTPQLAVTFNKSLVPKYPHQSIKALNGTHGIAIYSKFPISKTSYLYNPSRKPYAQICELAVNEKNIQVINTHLASPAVAVENKDRFFSLYKKNYRFRKNQIRQINNSVLKNASNYFAQILGGDLNTLQSEPLFQEIKWHWTHSYQHSFRWSKFNFPNSHKTRPLLTLDYILGKGNIHLLENEVIQGGSSDHLAIVTTLQI